MKFQIAILIALLTICGCHLDPDSKTVHYEGQIVLNREIAEIIDNECIEGEIALLPSEQSPENLYLVENPDDIDSVFWTVAYSFESTPHLEDYFAENGMLLVFLRDAAIEDSYIEHSISLNGDTISIDVSIEENQVDNPLYGTKSIVIPIGIIPEESSP